jgi:hypothetical protein
MPPRANSKPQRDQAPREQESQRVSSDRASDRITVALVARAAEDLQRLQDVTGLSKTDIVNRAISLYGFFQSQIDADNDFVVRDRKSGETQLVRFL